MRILFLSCLLIASMGIIPATLQAQTLVATDDYYTTMENYPLLMPVLLNDYTTAGFLGGVSITTLPISGASVTVNPGGLVSYIPPPGFIGNDSFTYSISNSLGDVATANVNVLVVATCPELSANISTPNNMLCNGLCNGELYATAWGGTPPYNYSWSNGVDGPPALMGLCFGFYTVTVTDANGCVAILNSNLFQAPPLTVNLTAAPSIIAPGGGSQLNALVFGGTSPYTFNWSPSTAISTTTIPNPLIAPSVSTLYSVTVTDANGCTAQSAVMVSVGPPLAPIAVNDYFEMSTTSAATSYTLHVLDNDTITGPVTITISDGPNFGTAAVVSNYIVYQPLTGFSGYATFTYTICTPSGNCASATVVLFFSGSGCDLIVGISSVNPTCDWGSCNGTLAAMVTGGTPPYTYQWTGPDGFLSNANLITNVCPGNYVLIVTDAMGCIQFNNSVIVVFAPDAIISASALSIMPGETTTLTALPDGGIPPYFYLWNTGETSSNITVSTPGNYCVTIIDSNGCDFSTCITITDAVISPPIALTDTIYTQVGQTAVIAPLLNDIGTAPLSLLSAISELSLIIDYDNNLISITNSDAPDTLYINYIFSDATGAIGNGTIVVIVLPDDACTLNCVWPGDTDNNGTANNFDVLNIGLAYDFTGAPRGDQSTGWYAHFAADWPGEFADGVNHKFADANGNGTVNAADTTAISLNYGLTHGKNGSSSSSGAPLFYNFESQSGTNIGDTISLTIHLGNTDNPLTNFYGIAYSVNYDGTLLHLAQLNAPGSTWAGNTANSLFFTKDIGSSQTDAAFTRINHANVSGQGVIAQATFVIIENIDGKNETKASVDMLFSITNARCISNNGNEIELSPQDLTLTYTSANNPIQNAAAISIYPNPAGNTVNLQLPEATQVQLFDITGKILYAATLPQGTQTLNTAQLPNGFYFINLNGSRQKTTQKLVVQH